MDFPAAIAQLGERQTEDLKVSGSIPDRGMFNVTVYTSETSPWPNHGFDPESRHVKRYCLYFATVRASRRRFEYDLTSGDLTSSC